MLIEGGKKGRREEEEATYGAFPIAFHTSAVYGGEIVIGVVVGGKSAEAFMRVLGREELKGLLGNWGAISAQYPFNNTSSAVCCTVRTFARSINGNLRKKKNALERKRASSTIFPKPLGAREKGRSILFRN